jgi:hypothetical protein
MTKKDQDNLANLYLESFEDSSYPSLQEALRSAIEEYGRDNVRQTKSPSGSMEILVKTDQGWDMHWSEDGWDHSSHQDGAGWA